MILRILILFVLLMACGRDEKPAVVIDAKLGAIMETFKSDAAERGVSLKEIELSKLAFVGESPYGELLGSCARENSHGTWEILIVDPSNGTDLKTSDRDFNLRRLVYHELGHCYLDKPHGGKSDFSIMKLGFLNSVERPGMWDELATEFWQ